MFPVFFPMFLLFINALCTQIDIAVQATEPTHVNIRFNVPIHWKKCKGTCAGVCTKAVKFYIILNITLRFKLYVSLQFNPKSELILKNLMYSLFFSECSIQIFQTHPRGFSVYHTEREGRTEYPFIFNLLLFTVSLAWNECTLHEMF